MSQIKDLQLLLDYLNEEQLEEDIVDVEMTPELESIIKKVGFNEVEGSEFKQTTHYHIRGTNTLRIKVFWIKQVLDSHPR